MAYQPRLYREHTKPKDLVSFKAAVSETDLFVAADCDLYNHAQELILRTREDIENYINLNPEFAKTLTPVKPGKNAPPIINDMIQAGRLCGVGPMAAIAGAIAETIGRELLVFSPQVIVENGGDIFIASKRTRIVGIYAGRSKFTDKIGIKISPHHTPCGLCTSSATVGESLSFGRADAVSVLSYSAALADACATALCNIVRGKDDIKRAIDRGKRIRGIKGLLIIIDNTLGAWGDMKLVDI